MERFARPHRVLSSFLIVALALGFPAPSYALKPEALSEKKVGLEELKEALAPFRQVVRAAGLSIPAAGLEEAGGKAFVAVTVPQLNVPDDVRARIDARVRGAIGAAFGGERLALEFGPGTAPLEKQTQDENLRTRGQAAYDLLLAAAQARSPQRAEALKPPRLVLVATDDDPALLHTDAAGKAADEESATFHLIGSSGEFDWQGTAQSPGSHYVKLALIEDAQAAFGKDKKEQLMKFLGAWAAHEDKDEKILNDGYAAIREFRYQRRLAEAEKARERQLEQTTVEVANIRLGRQIVASGIPQVSVEAAKNILVKAKERGEIEGFRVLAAADDLVLQVNHHHGSQSPLAGRLIEEVGTAALQAAANKKQIKDSGKTLLSSGYWERAKGLGIRRESMPSTERGAEPTLVVHAVNGGAGTFNRAIWRALINLDTHPSARIAGDKFGVVVESIDDVRRGRKDRVRYRFKASQREEALALVGDHSEYMITEVYAEAGRFAQSNPGEPVVKVFVEPVDADGYTEAPANPTMIARVQSGSEALGVFTEALGNPWVAPGGANDAYHLTTIPVSWEQGNQAPQHGFINLVAYEYLSYGDGRLPLDRDIIDPFNPVARPDAGLLAKFWGDKTPELQVTFQLAQERAHKIAKFMMGHGEMDPFLTARGAEALSEQTAKRVEPYWQPLPKTELSVAEGGEVDPAVAIANVTSKGRTFTVIKADAGGEGGHLVPPAYFSLAAEATRDIMLQDELIRSGEHFAVGDDNEVLTVHRKGIDNHDIHITNYRIFWRMVYLAANYELLQGQVKARDKEGVGEQVRKIFSAKIYQAGQDLVSEAARGKPVPQLAGVDGRSIARMAELLRKVGRGNQADALEYGYQIYKAGQGTVVATVSPFKGNITGQGPGFAEVPLPAEGPVRVAGFFTDKDGPAAFNVPIVWILEQALARGLIRKKGGAIAEVYDTKAQKHIFFDVETQMDIIRGLASNPDRYNFKRVISKKKAGWDPAQWREYLGDQWFISVSTEKLSIITGGEYRGKDDSVLLAFDEFGELGFEFDARFSYFTQGDGFGSHDTTVRPELLPTAIATMHSRAVKAAFWIDISADDQMTFTEVYTDPAFRGIRREGEEMTRLLWEVQGAEFTPVGVGWRRVERSYPLAKAVVAITGIDWDLLADTTTDKTQVSVEEVLRKSPFAVAAHVDAAQNMVQGEWAGKFPAVNQQTTAKVARMAHDTRNPKTVLLDESFFAQGFDGAMAVQRTLGELGFDSPDLAARNGAVKLLVSLSEPSRLPKLIEDVNASSRGAVRLKPEWFTAVTGTPEKVDVKVGPSYVPASAAFHQAINSLALAPTGLEEKTVFLAFDGAAGLALAQAGLEALVVVPTPTDFKHQVELGLPPQRAIGLLWGGLEERDYRSIAPIGRVVDSDPGSSADWQQQVIGAARAGLGPQRKLQVVFDSLTLASGLEELGIPGSTVQEILQSQAQRAADLAQMK